MGVVLRLPITKLLILIMKAVVMMLAVVLLLALLMLLLVVDSEFVCSRRSYACLSSQQETHRQPATSVATNRHQQGEVQI